MMIGTYWLLSGVGGLLLLSMFYLSAVHRIRNGAGFEPEWMREEGEALILTYTIRSFPSVDSCR